MLTGISGSSGGGAVEGAGGAGAGALLVVVIVGVGGQRRHVVLLVASPSGLHCGAVGLALPARPAQACLQGRRVCVLERHAERPCRQRPPPATARPPEEETSRWCCCSAAALYGVGIGSRSERVASPASCLFGGMGALRAAALVISSRPFSTYPCPAWLRLAAPLPPFRSTPSGAAVLLYCYVYILSTSKPLFVLVYTYDKSRLAEKHVHCVRVMYSTQKYAGRRRAKLHGLGWEERKVTD